MAVWILAINDDTNILAIQQSDRQTFNILFVGHRPEHKRLECTATMLEVVSFLVWTGPSCSCDGLAMFVLYSCRGPTRVDGLGSATLAAVHEYCSQAAY